MTIFKTQEDVREYMRENAGFLVVSGVMKVPDFIKHFEHVSGLSIPRAPQGIEVLCDQAAGYDHQAAMTDYVMAMFNYVYETEWVDLSDEDREKLNVIGEALKGQVT